MSIHLSDFKNITFLDKIIFSSNENCFYNLIVEVDGEEHVILDSKDKLITKNSVQELLSLIGSIETKYYILRHSNVYDEMISSPRESRHIDVILNKKELFYLGKSLY